MAKHVQNSVSLKIHQIQIRLNQYKQFGKKKKMEVWTLDAWINLGPEFTELASTRN